MTWTQNYAPLGGSIGLSALVAALPKMPPVVPETEAEPAQFTFNLLSATGTALCCAGVLAGLFLGLSPLLGWLGVALTGSDTSSDP